MVVQDDVTLFPGFYQMLIEEIVAEAPAGAHALQFKLHPGTLSSGIPGSHTVEMLLLLQETFVKWMPEYEGLGVVWISLNGAKELNLLSVLFLDKMRTNRMMKISNEKANAIINAT